MVHDPGHDDYHPHDHADGRAHDHFHDHSGAAVWAADHIDLKTIGIDVGSSTSHFMFAHVHLHRLTTALSSRFVVVGREVIWRSKIMLTPYRTDSLIDAERLATFLDEGYREAGISREAVDSGAIILTGEALKRENARAIADLFSSDAGKFVCALAGHHLECVLGAHGSGAVEYSSRNSLTLLNVDIGGGTTKLTLIRNGEIVASAALEVGARLLVTDHDRRITRLDEPLVKISRELGIPLSIDAELSPDSRSAIIGRMVELLLGMIERKKPDALTETLLVTDWWPPDAATLVVDSITFSGGVAEYIYGRETMDFGDLGSDLARGLRDGLTGRFELHDPGQGIRATVIGAGQFSVQVSGNTIMISHPERLPLRNVPVLLCPFPLEDVIDPAIISAIVRNALVHADIEEGLTPVALAFRWSGTPKHPRLHAIARGIAAALPQTLARGITVVILIDGDIGMSLGRVLCEEVAPGTDIIAVDTVELNKFSYVDIGKVIEPADVVPVVIKSLVF